MTAENMKLHILTSAQTILLTTHKNSDGDGIGSLVALYWSLKFLNKSVYFVPVDEVPERYHYLIEGVTMFSPKDLPERLNKFDLLVVLDTNQGKLCEPLYSYVVNQDVQALFIDHHVNKHTAHKNDQQIVYPEASSTGEIVYEIIKALEVPMNDRMAMALYSSLTFDTQAFKLVRNSAKSHLIAAQLAEYKINTEKIQRALFANWTLEKMSFLSELIQTAKYYSQNTIVGLSIDLKQMLKYRLSTDDLNDLIDLFTLIKTIKFAFIIRQEEEHFHKLSFRSIDNNKAYDIAAAMGGGGHLHSAGAWIIDSTQDQIEADILKLLRDHKLLN